MNACADRQEPGLHARVSTRDQQTLPMQNRDLHDYAVRRGCRRSRARIRIECNHPCFRTARHAATHSHPDHSARRKLRISGWTRVRCPGLYMPAHKHRSNFVGHQPAPGQHHLRPAIEHQGGSAPTSTCAVGQTQLVPTSPTTTSSGRLNKVRFRPGSSGCHAERRQIQLLRVKGRGTRLRPGFRRPSHGFLPVHQQKKREG